LRGDADRLTLQLLTQSSDEKTPSQGIRKTNLPGGSAVEDQGQDIQATDEAGGGSGARD
jgi:hypothetical protein